MCSHDCNQGRRCTCAPHRTHGMDSQASRVNWVALVQIGALAYAVMGLAVAAGYFF